MFIRFRQMTAERYGGRYGGKRACVGKCRDRRRTYPRYGVGMWVEGRTFVKGCPMKPLCPLIEPRRRLEVSIVETHREDGKVRQRHVASLGSIADDDLDSRDVFWRECEVRLARLSNRIGPHLDKLREEIAARIPPLTDDDREYMNTWAWQQLAAGFGDRAERKSRESSNWNEHAKQARRDATRTEVIALEVKEAMKSKKVRDDPQVYRALNNLLGATLATDVGFRDIKVDWESVLAEIDRIARER